MKRAALAAVAAAWTVCAFGAEPALEPIKLPAPQMERGRPLMEVLKKRQSQRNFAPDRIPPQELGNLLWAACGVNRPESGKRTAPTAVNWQEIDVYVALPEGLYRYAADGHVLEPVMAGDLRPFAGRQKFVHTAPVVLIYVADFNRMAQASDENRVFYSATDTGFMSQNAYLYCASEGLATVVVGMVDKETLREKMKLKPGQRVILTQPVGLPGK